MPLIVTPRSPVSHAEPNNRSHPNEYAEVISTPLHAPTKPRPIDLNPPKAPKVPTSVPNYQTRWEREKAKARAEGADVEGRDPKMIGPWVLGEMLGRGASGRVRLARHFSTGKMAAVKILNLHPNLTSRTSTLVSAGEKAEKMMLTAEREIAVMKLLDHPNIMRMYDVWSSPKELYLVLEYVQGGELFDYLCSRGSRLPLLEAISIIKQVLAGVDYCHRFNICHRDLKPENILLTAHTVEVPGSAKTTEVKQVKIADFGMSTLDSLNGLLRTSCGSPHYASPEIVRGQTYSGAGSDIWSCGVILFALLTSRLPFDDPNVNNVLRKVRDGKFVIPEWVVPPAKDLLIRMLEVNINKRISMPEIFKHPLLQMDTPGIILPPAPNIDEIALPVIEGDIDSDLLRNLCIIWREKDKTSMVNRLCSEDKNFEKAFYFLLCRYRDRSFEEYNMDSLTYSSNSVPPSPAQIPHTTALPDRIASPIQRHYPGRASPQILATSRKVPNRDSNDSSIPIRRRASVSRKDSLTRRESLSRKGDAINRRGSINSDKTSPTKSKSAPPPEAKSSSPRKSRILSETSAAANGSPRGSMIAPNSNVSVIDNAKRRNGRRGSKSELVDLLHSGTPPTPSKRSSATSITPVLHKKSLEDRSTASVTTRTETTTPTSYITSQLQSGKHSTIHRRALSASSAVSSSWSPARREERGRPHPITKGDKTSRPVLHSAVATSFNPNTSATPVPRGIVNQRKSLLTAQLKTSTPPHIVDPLAPTGERIIAANVAHYSDGKTCTPITKRFTTPHTPTSPRPLSNIMSPTKYGPPSAGPLANRSNSPRSSHFSPTNRGTTPSQDGLQSSPTPSASPKISPIHPLIKPTNKTTLSSIMEAENLQFSDTLDLNIRGLGVFVSPPKSPSIVRTLKNPEREKGENGVEPIPIPPTRRCADNKDIFDNSSDAGMAFLCKVSNDGTKSFPRAAGSGGPQRLDRGSNKSDIHEQPKRSIHLGASGTIGSSKSSDYPSGGRSSGNASNSSEDAWEKLDMLTDPSNSGDMNVMGNAKNKKIKRRPAPLDLLNPHQSNRRIYTRATPTEVSKQLHSPLLSPFLGFWGGGSSTPPTPSLAGSPATTSATSSHLLAYGGNGGGRGLFAKLFDWKSPNLHLLSYECPSTTREECGRILRELNVVFAPTESGGFKCRADDILDPQGNRIVKAVRFRIEIHSVTCSPPTTPCLTNSLSSTSSNERSSASASYSQWSNHARTTTSPRPASMIGHDQKASHKKKHRLTLCGPTNSEASVLCTLVFIQEKGAYSVLKIIHQVIKDTWRLDNVGMIVASQIPEA